MFKCRLRDSLAIRGGSVGWLRFSGGDVGYVAIEDNSYKGGDSEGSDSLKAVNDRTGSRE